MRSFALHFAKAINAGRRLPQPVATRASLLVALLNKRAVAHNVGAEELEELLRAQIRWSLPIVHPVDAPDAHDEPESLLAA
jgi:hypothetical protein